MKINWVFTCINGYDLSLSLPLGGFGRLKSALGLINGAATGGEISVVAMHLQARAELDAELAALLGAARDRRVRAVSTPWLRRGGRAECNGAHGGGRWT